MNTPATTTQTTTYTISPEKQAELDKGKAIKERLKREAPGKTRRQCLDLCHELTVAWGGKAADLRTRAYRDTKDTYYRVCQSVQTPETLRQWDDEEMEESRAAWAAKRAA